MPNPYKKRKSVESRLVRVERKQAMRRPELKKLPLAFRPTGIIPANGQAFADLTGGIAQGVGTTTRVGKEVRLKKIIIRGDPIGQWQGNNKLVDVYLIELHDNNSLPQASDYPQAVGGEINTVAGKCWRHQTFNYGSGDSSLLNWEINIPNGRRLVWDDALATKPVQGNLYLHVINRSSTPMADGDINLSYAVFFEDC